MRTKLDLDDELFIPEREIDWSVARPSRFTRKPGEKHEIRIDGAVAYQLRLLPANKVLARFASTLEAWPAIIAAVDAGRSPRTMSLDWVDADGLSGSISAGPRLERWARRNNGDPVPDIARPTRRAVEGVA